MIDKTVEDRKTPDGVSETIQKSNEENVPENDRN